MEGILFVINPIWWDIQITWLSLGIAIFGGLLIGISLKYKQTQKIETKTPKYTFQFIDNHDPLYAEKTLDEIRRYLTTTYYPMHSWAHIPRDIKRYTTDNELIAIIQQLEQIEFSGKIPEENMITSIHQALSKKLYS